MKKFLSLAIAVIMIMTAFVTMIPAVSATETGSVSLLILKPEKS